MRKVGLYNEKTGKETGPTPSTKERICYLHVRAGTAATILQPRGAGPGTF